ncbi:hypothetical protein LDP04_24910, partial [Ralstonia pseudosolanacearum]
VSAIGHRVIERQLLEMDPRQPLPDSVALPVSLSECFRGFRGLLQRGQLVLHPEVESELEANGYAAVPS